jgi:hypothetical protein
MCRLVGRRQRFGEIYCLHLQDWSGDTGTWRFYKGSDEGQLPSLHFLTPLFQTWRWRQYVSPKRWYLPLSLYGVRTQKKNIIFNAVKTSNLAWVDECKVPSILIFDTRRMGMFSFMLEPLYSWEGDHSNKLVVSRAARTGDKQNSCHCWISNSGRSMHYFTLLNSYPVHINKTMIAIKRTHF